MRLLFEEIRQQGYTGSYSHLARFVAAWKDSERPLDVIVEATVEPPSSTLAAPDFHPCFKAPAIDPTTGRRISPLTAAALCMKPRGQMTPRQICTVDALKAASKEFTIKRQLAMRFRGLFHSGSREKLNEWLWDALSCGIYTIRRFATTLRHDIDAV
ncbi:hypothetical protein [Methylocystis bryophila]|uniref:hypothetical protein n=1 Tax=Methylocystis bryophila TaxID=655015 RepID=UPI000A268953|nr:hypothetical protein [Methylocystis bryophila]BDV37150.1 hypothetical protein DSM21852_04030 [Methylocystis bryophila]